MKICIIGAGSTYTPELVEGIINKRDTLPVTELVFMDIDEALSNPLVTDTAKTLIQTALCGKAIPAVDCRKNRWMYSVDKIQS